MAQADSDFYPCGVHLSSTGQERGFSEERISRRRRNRPPQADDGSKRARAARWEPRRTSLIAARPPRELDEVVIIADYPNVAAWMGENRGP